MRRCSTIRKFVCLFAPLFAAVSDASSREPASVNIANAAASSASLAPSQFSKAKSKAQALLINPWRTNIVATVFWVGEQPTEKNPTTNTASSWDSVWMSSFGGYDDPAPAKRAADFRPASFVPQQNPFYVALPYNDVIDDQTTKPEASKIIPWFNEEFERKGKSVCHNRWIAVRHGNRTCYAQWSDCGPFKTTDANYVFGGERPANSKNRGAGIDLAPAVRDYLGFNSGDTCDWRFVKLEDVPDGPWKNFGANNSFAKNGANAPRYASALRSGPGSITPVSKADTSTGKLSGNARLEELRRQRDNWFK